LLQLTYFAQLLCHHNIFLMELLQLLTQLLNCLLNALHVVVV
jgi:hypothetical protein